MFPSTGKRAGQINPWPPFHDGGSWGSVRLSSLLKVTVIDAVPPGLRCSLPQSPTLVTVEVQSWSCSRRCPQLKAALSEPPPPSLGAHSPWLDSECTEVWLLRLNLGALSGATPAPGRPTASAEASVTMAPWLSFPLCPSRLCSLPHSVLPENTPLETSHTDWGHRRHC